MNTHRNFILLSHSLNTSTPVYGGGQALQRKSLSTISESSHSNSEEWNFKNHMGTHMDFPRHFVKGGKSLSQYGARDFYFAKVALVEVSAQSDQILLPQDIPLPATDCELLFIKTSFEKHRGQERYWKNNPGLDPSVADYLRKQLPQLRAVGFDFISLTAYQHRELGRAAHRAFLQSERELLVIEDVHLAQCQLKNFSAIVAPLWVEEADGSPVSIFAFT